MQIIYVYDRKFLKRQTCNCSSTSAEITKATAAKTPPIPSFCNGRFILHFARSGYNTVSNKGM